MILKVTMSKRQILNKKLKDGVLEYAYGLASPEEIDELNIYNATQVAMNRALSQLVNRPDHLLIDAMSLDTTIPQTSIIKGDAKSVSIVSKEV